jgi:deoxyribodipyrimidine photolyase-related protein
MNRQVNTLKLILGDQLNINHPWFQKIDERVTYVMMEVRSETDYVRHHIQKVVAVFDAMRKFADSLVTLGHKVHYIHISDPENKQTISGNLLYLLKLFNAETVHYQLPDEFRVDQELQSLSSLLHIPVYADDTYHFLTERNELKRVFEGKKTYVMESFYRKMRLKYDILLQNSTQPIGGKWNFDQENRKKVPKNHTIITTELRYHDCSDLVNEINQAGIQTIGNIESAKFSWTTNRADTLKLLDDFIVYALPLFGTLQDAMTEKHWYLYHSRLSFALNVKLISPLEVIKKVERAFFNTPEKYALNQVEGFIRQILGWREYMRGIYWAHMPDFASMNYFEHKNPLPTWFWNGETKMNCLKHAIKQSLDFAYAHHIQRLMITGNFTLLAGIHPDEVDNWYLGIYIDAFEWVEITNTRGMSQFADGGIVGSKPYVSSAAYIHKMGDYCDNCKYQYDKKTGENSCPFNSLYWNFYAKNFEKLAKNQRLGMMLTTWRKKDTEEKNQLLKQAAYYLNHIEEL